MLLPNSTRRAAKAITGILMMALAGAAFAANPPTAPSAPTKETRERTATLHEQMAACLRSHKSIAECRTEMMQHCQAMMGKPGCTRMMGSGGMMGMGRGMMGMEQGMYGPMTSKPPSNPPN